MNKVKLEDLKCVDGLYYIGDLIDVDCNPWVEESVALEIVDEENEKRLKEIVAHDELMRSLNEKHRVSSYIKRIAKQDPIKEFKKQLK